MKLFAEFLAWTLAILGILKGIIEILKLSKEAYKSRIERNRGITEVISSYKENTERLKSIVETQEGQTEMLKEVLIQQAFQSKAQELIINENGVFWLSDSTGGTIKVGKGAMELTGRSFDELKGYNWFNYVVDEDKDRVQKDMTSAMTKESDFTTHYKLIKKDKKIVNVECYAEIVKQNSVILGWIGRIKQVA